MRKLNVFESLSLDGYFSGKDGDFSWAHGRGQDDSEWNDFVSNNASGGGALLFGHVTYDVMTQYWPTPQAAKDMPAVAKGMNAAKKFVASKAMSSADWNNTEVLKGDLISNVRELKAGSGPDITILGSGNVVAQLTQAALIDSYQFVIVPVVIGEGRSLFEGVSKKRDLTLSRSRSFKNGNVVVWYDA